MTSRTIDEGSILAHRFNDETNKMVIDDMSLPPWVSLYGPAARTRSKHVSDSPASTPSPLLLHLVSSLLHAYQQAYDINSSRNDSDSTLKVLESSNSH
mmetsp:Transcript_15915/g.40935  ORF Transcript_15915/g.40935 Transcript_15915/m.40935 type:complete len:98 (-) Transcript_15915:98-391(-)